MPKGKAQQRQAACCCWQVCSAWEEKEAGVAWQACLQALYGTVTSQAQAGRWQSGKAGRGFVCVCGGGKNGRKVVGRQQCSSACESR